MRSCLLYAQPGPNIHLPHYRCTLLCPWQMVTNNWSAKHTEVHAWVIAGNIGHDCPLISFYRTKHSKFQRGVAFYKKCKWTQLKYLQDEYLRVQFSSSIVHTSWSWNNKSLTRSLGMLEISTLYQSKYREQIQINIVFCSCDCTAINENK